MNKRPPATLAIEVCDNAHKYDNLIEVLSPDNTTWRVLVFQGHGSKSANWFNPVKGSYGATAYVDPTTGEQLIRPHVPELTEA